MSDIAKRLLASLKFDAINGDATERAICSRQMREAAAEIVTLREQINAVKYQYDILEREQGILQKNDIQERLRCLAAAEIVALRAELLTLYSALHTAEAALADIGDADRNPGDDVAWCEARAARALPQVRAAIGERKGNVS